MTLERNCGEVIDYEKDTERSEKDGVDMLDVIVAELDKVANGSMKMEEEDLSKVGIEMNNDMDLTQTTDVSMFISDNVVNLSKRVLTKAEICLSTKGLKFCVTPRDLDCFFMQRDFKDFDRKVKCRAYFLSNNEVYNKNYRDKFRKKSAWVPKEVGTGVRVYLSKLWDRIFSIKERGRNYSNPTTAERDALESLRIYWDIIIKEADKGSAVVVWGREEYCKEASDQLGDSEVHEVVDNYPINEVSSLISRELDILIKEGYISRTNKKYFLNSRPRLGRFYLLPKIHKRLENVPGRPVISNCVTVTE